MSRDRGVQADIWQRHEARAESVERRKALRVAADMIARAIKVRPARFLSSVREQLIEGEIPTAKQIEAVNKILQERGFPKVRCPTRDEPVVAQQMRNEAARRDRRSAAGQLDKLQAQRPLQPPGKKVTW